MAFVSIMRTIGNDYPSVTTWILLHPMQGDDNGVPPSLGKADVRLIEQGARVVSGIRISVTIERATNSRFTIARRIGPAGTSVSSRYYSGFTAKIAKKRNSLLPRSRFERNMWCFKNKVTFRPGVYDEYRIASCFALIGRDDKPHSACACGSILWC
jgi:hypothetical protein